MPAEGPPSSSKKKKRDQLPLATRRAILRYLRDKPALPDISFHQHCNRDPNTFGNPLTPFRQKVQQFCYDNYRYYIKPTNGPPPPTSKFYEKLERFGLSPTPDSNDEDLPAESLSFDVAFQTPEEDASLPSESTSLPPTSQAPTRFHSNRMMPTAASPSTPHGSRSPPGDNFGGMPETRDFGGMPETRDAPALSFGTQVLNAMNTRKFSSFDHHLCTATTALF